MNQVQQKINETMALLKEWNMLDNLTPSEKGRIEEQLKDIATASLIEANRVSNNAIATLSNNF